MGGVRWSIPQVKALWKAANEGNWKAFEQIMNFTGLHIRGPFDELGAGIPDWFRSAGSSHSVSHGKVWSRYLEDSMILDGIKDAAFLTNKNLQDALSKLSLDEMEDFFRLVDTPRTQRKSPILMASVHGDAVPPSEKVLDAIRLHDETIDFDWGTRNANWDRHIERRAFAIKKIINDAGGKPLDDAQKEAVARLMAPNPAHRENYIPQFLKEFEESKDKHGFVDSHIRGFERRRVEEGGGISLIQREMGSEVASKHYIEMMERIAKRPQGEAYEARIAAIRANIVTERSLLRGLTSDQLGGVKNRNRILEDLDTLSKYADSMAEVGPKNGSKLLSGWDWTMNSLRHGNLFLTPFWYIANPIGDWTKAFMERGFQIFDKPYNMQALDGSMLRIGDWTKASMERGFQNNMQALDGSMLRSHPVAQALGTAQGSRSMMDLPGLSWLNDNITRRHTNYWLRSQRDAVLSTAYRQYADEALKAGMPRIEAHRMALPRAQADVSRVMFDYDDMAPAMALMNRLFLFGVYPIKNFMFHTRWMADHPRSGAMLLRLKDKLKDASIDGSGMVYVPGTSVRIDPQSYFEFNQAARVLDNTRTFDPFDPSDEVVGKIVKTARMADSFAYGMFGTSIPERALDLINYLSTDFTKKMIDDPWKFDERQLQKTGTSAAKTFMGPFDEVAEAVYGKPLWVLALNENEEDKAFSYYNKQHFKAARGANQNIDMAEANRRAHNSIRAQSILRMFGLRGELDPSGMMPQYRAIDRMRRNYNSKRSVSERTQIYYGSEFEGRPLLEGMVQRYPDMLKDKLEIESILKTDDPKKILDVYERADEDKKQGLFENVWDKIIGAWKNLRASAAEELRRPMIAEASAAEIEPNYGKHLKAMGIASGKPIAIDLDPREDQKQKTIGYDIPVLLPSGEYAFYRPWAKGQISHDPVNGTFKTPEKVNPNAAERRRIQERNLNVVVKTFENKFQFADTKDELNKLRGEKYVFQDGSKNPPTVDTEFLLRRVKYRDMGEIPLLAAMLLKANETGAHRGFVPKTGIARETSFEYLSFGKREMISWLLDNEKLPKRVRDNERELKETRNSILRNGVNKLQEAVGSMRHDQKNPPYEPDSAIGDIYRMTERKELPADFYKQVLMSGDENFVRTIRDFAVARHTRHLDHFYTWLHDPDRNGVERINRVNVGNLLASGRHRELQLISLFDRDVRDELNKRAYPTDPAEVQGQIMYDFAAGVIGVDDPSDMLDIVNASFGMMRPPPSAKRGLRDMSPLDIARPGLLDLPSETFRFIRSLGKGKPIQPGEPDATTPEIRTRIRPGDTAYIMDEPSGIEPQFVGPVKPGGQPTRERPDITIRIKQSAPVVSTLSAPVVSTLYEFKKPSYDARIKMTDSGYREYESVRDFIHSAARDTRKYNSDMRELEALGAMEGKRLDWQPANIFHTMLRRSPRLHPEGVAAAASSAMLLGYYSGIVTEGQYETIQRGITQQSFMNLGTSFAEGTLEFFGNSMAGISAAERVTHIRNGYQVINASGQVTATVAASPMLASLVQYGGPTGTLLSIGSGIANAQGEEELAMGLGAAGGAFQGAALGAAVSGPAAPIGALVGAAIGAAVGYFTSTLGKKKKIRGLTPEQIEERERQKAEFERRRSQQEAEIGARRAISTRRAEVEAISPGRQRQLDLSQRLATFFRRPTFQSSMGLVGEVERRAARKLQPRF